MKIAPWLLLATGWGCSANHARSAGGSGEAVWREIHSRHFVLQTDADSDDARSALANLETTYETLRAILFAGSGGAAEPMHLVIFAHGADLHRFIPSGSAAAFFPALPNDPDSKPTMLLETSLTEEARRMFVHEMTHAFIERSFSSVPIWLGEGLAEYFETMRIESGRVILGDPIPNYAIPPNRMPSLPALFSADAATFYGGRDAHSVEGMRQQVSYYAAAWYLVHMFMHGKAEYRARFQDFLDALKRREPAASAWSRTFDEATSQRLALDYLEYLRTDQLDAGFVQVDVHPADQVSTIEVLMRRDEVDNLSARLSRRAARR